MKGQRWLVVRGGALGDFVLTTPAIRALRAQVGHLHLLCNPRFAAPFPGLADRVSDLHGAAGAWLFAGGQPAELPDGALVYTPGVAEILAKRGVPRVIEGAAHPAPGQSALMGLWAPIAFMAGPKPPAPTCQPNAQAQARIQRLLGPRAPVILAPGAAAPTKQWPHFGALAHLLNEMGEDFCWAPGADEGPLQRGLPGQVLPVLDLPDLVALAAICRAWIGNDTGTSHLAAAAGAATHVLFGPTDPAQWRPSGATAWPFHSAPATLLAAALAQPSLPRVNFP